MRALLFEVVEVDPSEKIRCRAPGCHQTIYKRIHVVIDGDRAIPIGSNCWLRFYANSIGADVRPKHGGSRGRLLTADERALIEVNTAEFVARVEERVARAGAEADAERARLEAERLRTKERERARWRAPEFDPDDPPYVFEDRDKDFRRAGRAVPAGYVEHDADQTTRDLVARLPVFRRFPSRWIARALQRAREDYIANGLKPDEPGSRQRIEATALELLERHYRL